MAKRDPKPGSRDDASELGFEAALEQVEQIIARIESGDVGLEGSIDEYEKGVTLIARCREILDRTEQRVEDLTQRMKSASEREA